MKKQKHFLTLLLILGAWPSARSAQAATGNALGAWGDNEFGQTTVPVAAQSGVTAIAAGGSHTASLKTDGSVVAWGDNEYGQTTVPVAAQSGVTAISAGSSHTVALKNDGSVVAWGRNIEGQSTVPAGLTGVAAIAAGGYHTVALKTDGSVTAWGYNGNGQTTVPVAAQSGVTAIAAGFYYSVALKTDGSVLAWGDNEFGQTTVPVAAQSGVTAIAARLSHTVALKNDGSVVAWGRNVEGQTTVPAGLSEVTAIAAGWYHTLALKNDGSVAAWGANGYNYGQAAVPAGLSGATAIAAGGLHTVALVIPTAPTITMQPASQTVNQWQSASFTVTATGYPLNYQWRKDGVNLAEARSATYNLGPAQTNHAGGYTVVVSNFAGSVTSAPPALLTVNPVSPGSVAVGAWGRNDFGQTTVPVAAQSGVTAIAAGLSHTVALKNDGSVVAWGDNGKGQTTVPVAARSGVAAIAVGADHTVALKNDGSVVAWGSNDSGQTDVPVAARSGVTVIAAGWFHTVALKSDGSVVVWGRNVEGQTTVPAGLSGVTAIAAGEYHTVALKTDGSVVAWGYNQSGQTTVPVAARSGVTAIVAGGSHTVALKNDGSVVAWGYNQSGQTTVPVAAQSGVTAIAGGGSYTLALKNDGSVVAWPANTVLEGLSGVTAIAAGGGHTVVLVIPTALAIATQPVSQTVNEWRSASFTVTATGYPLYYQWRKDGADLDEATSPSYNLPFTQTNQAGSYTVVVSNPAGSVTSTPPAVLTVNVVPGSVVAWGYTDVPVASQSAVTAIAAGWYHSVALKNDGTVVAWGYNGSGQVTGTPTGDEPATASPVTLAGQVLSGVTAIAAGYYNTVALKNDGSVVAWGKDDFGQTDVPVAAQSGVTAIAAGWYHSVVLKNDGSVVAWGYNPHGQVTGTPTSDEPYSVTASPVTLGGQVLSGVTAIAAGWYHSVALKNDDTVVAWGYNPYGQVTGTPTAADPYSATASPVTLGGQVLSGVTAIAAGVGHTVALKNDGSVVAWGRNAEGQVTGTPALADPYSATASPVTLGGQVLSGVTAIAAGGYCSLFGGCGGHTLALKNDGSLVAWGDNRYGQVTGAPTFDYPYATASPVTLGGQVLSGVTAIAAGGFHTVALLGTGLLMPVSLNSRLSGNELILSWSTNVVGFTLQSTLSLTPPLTWIDSTSAPAVIGAQFTVTKTITGSAQFYRLRKP